MASLRFGRQGYWFLKGLALPSFLIMCCFRHTYLTIACPTLLPSEVFVHLLLLSASVC